ncbi:uncharacterized protein TRAVEDRAFT_27548 [Trametes versicolor FP-101664 SS1]|uniref:uncharacterized protein n=1 Tax=Trametes versicolor (strain FP-101664) TaxID=717944 RepID=UPI000462358D|nr:uncharacterized protein TRAVEDRAFT_27548 [Trametes versicolor FP-101664 SS1]EIW62214.1 hypothetical protein TRAVEDRAFT_27548 [Trametes versicolor FP-101664 SS1]
MQCNWSKTASFLLRNYPAKTSFRSCARITQLTPRVGRYTIPPTGLLPHLRGFRGLATSATPSTLQGDTKPSEPDGVTTSIRETSAGLSAAQISRAAAQAVRLSVQEGNYGDALYVVNSACHSVLQGPLDASAQRASRLQPIQFGCAVSPRLSAHSFLHGLIRAGYAKKAETYARLMLRAGIPIRSSTLESVVSSLVASPSSLPKFGPFARIIPRKPAIDHPSAMQLRSDRVTDKCARAALTLLQEARIFGQRRTERMYKVLIGTLLMQGEILVASLLFVLLLKDFELRKREVIDNDDRGGPNYITHDTLRQSLPSRAALVDMPFPNPQIMRMIVDAIAAKNELESDSPTSQYLQSLAIFAMLLDTGQIGHPRVASLIAALYQCPKTSARVWILRDGKPVRVGAYTYIHGVLKRLICALGTGHPTRPTPELSRKAYNSLLSYALRHRLSPEMASTVLQHMCVVREPPFAPDLVTYNILLRSGTLLRNMSISEAVLTVLRNTTKDGTLQTMFGQLEADRVKALDAAAPSKSADGSERTASSEGERVITRNAPSLDRTLQRLQMKTLTLPESVRNPTRKIASDQYTLSSFVTHLTSTGQPEAITKMLFKVLPELHLIRHPARASEFPERIPQRFDRTKALQRAVAHGPYVYASLINALAKAGDVGLAERVLILAQRAERASHTGLVPDVDPWRLSVHAYTAMMQAYAKAARGRKRAPHHVGAELLQESEGRVHALTHQNQRHGYALFVQMMSEQDRRPRTLTRPQQSRRNAKLLYRSMTSGGRAVLEGLVRNKAVNPGRTRKMSREAYKIKPDARFFNAALALFAPRPKRTDNRRRSRAHWERQLRLDRTRQHSGTAPKASATLQKLAKWMVTSGFDVPLGYRPLLKGTAKTDNWDARWSRKTLVCYPYAFPRLRRHCSQPFSIPTFKTRGLPIGRRTVRRTRKSAKGLNTVDTVT